MAGTTEKLTLLLDRARESERLMKTIAEDSLSQASLLDQTVEVFTLTPSFVDSNAPVRARQQRVRAA
ncbi:hypothetical protein GCM10007989_16100 [Devosia pacifica]|uniref:Uncharacterized protein n=1 Tax=Devosia pacifica TaxID=1335967 RepID=A0A918S2R8_9HYPH|nr:hypothetical protein [Devosia pacifica]GHA21543.1 hypothetical protein GCM10007989_16100 [Devosia pacifica]